MTGIFTYRGNFALSDTPRLDGKVALVTGGQAGIGQEISKQLLLHGVEKLYIVARSEEKYNRALQEWRENPDINLDAESGQSPQESNSRVQFVQCDLGDIPEVKRAVDYVRSDTDRLDMLFCNAGLPILPKYTLSPQSIETIFATNCVGHQILITLLLPLLRSTITKHAATDVRIVVTSSSLHSFCRELDLGLLTARSDGTSACYGGMWRYGRSKLGNILVTRELSRRLMADAEVGAGTEDGSGTGESSKRIFINCFFPGNIATEQMDIWKEYLGTLLGSGFKKFCAVAGQSTQDGAATAMFLATSPQVSEGEGIRGEYFIPVAKRDDPSALAMNRELGTELWDWNEKKISETLGDGWQKQ